MSFHSLHHSFDIDLATKYGIEEALLIHHFQHWIRINRKRKKNLRNGKCWMYQSRADMAAHFPYMNYEAVRWGLERLIELGILVSDNYNRAKFDKTLWYAFVDEKKFGVDQESIDQEEENSKKSYERGKPQTNGVNPKRDGVNPQPIPDTKEEDAKEGVSKDTQGKAPEAQSVPKFVYHLITMPEERYKKLIADFGEERVRAKLEALHEYSGMKAKKFKEYTDHAMVLRKWLKEDIKNEPQIQNANPEKKSSVTWKGKKIL